MTSVDRRLEAPLWAKWWAQAGERELRQILFWCWDPIGVAEHFPFPESEYDEYATRIASLLRDGASPEAVDYYLGTVERESMGLTASHRREATRRDVARFICKWYPQSLERWREFGPSGR